MIPTKTTIGPIRTRKAVAVWRRDGRELQYFDATRHCRRLGHHGPRVRAARIDHVVPEAGSACNRGVALSVRRDLRFVTPPSRHSLKVIRNTTAFHITDRDPASLETIDDINGVGGLTESHSRPIVNPSPPATADWVGPRSAVEDGARSSASCLRMPVPAYMPASLSPRWRSSPFMAGVR